MHFVGALDREPDMKCVLALFEGVATGAADGYFRMARKPASTLLHLGPGLANGIANLHNARKARSAIVNIVGEHATPHLSLDAPLTADIEGLAGPVSHWVKTSRDASTVGADGAEAVAASMNAPGEIATLILPGDTAWNEGGRVAAPVAFPSVQAFNIDQLEYAAEALNDPESLLFVGAEALTLEALDLVGKISAKTSCQVLAEWSNARWRRGAGRLAIDRLPYAIDRAIDVLKPIKRIVLVGSKTPIGFFAYPNKPSVLIQEGTQVVDLAPPETDLFAALDALCQAVGANKNTPINRAEYRVPDRATGTLTPEVIGVVLARTIPENAIVVDESVSSGASFIQSTMGANPHDWLGLRGGSIGDCLPIALGAALACPDRPVIAVTGDGSAMYTLQALWSMARENLDITIVILTNRKYQILLGEFQNVGVPNPGPRALDMMSLENPDLNFVDMARGMGVEAIAVEDAESFERIMRSDRSGRGPLLIDVIM